MKIRCLLVDDEPWAIKLLQKHMEQLESFEVASTCNNALKAMEILNSQDIDLLFLDIKMPKVTGIDLLKTLRKPPKTIITTAYREYALDGYDLDIVDYLLRPITFDRFLRSIERYMRSIDKSVLPASSPEEKYIYIKAGNKFFKLVTTSILYIESLKDYIKIFTKEREIVAKYKIGDIERELADKGFIRVHRSYIVNPKNITSVAPNDIEIGQMEIPIGSSYKEYVFKMLNIDNHSG